LDGNKSILNGDWLSGWSEGEDDKFFSPAWFPVYIEEGRFRLGKALAFDGCGRRKTTIEWQGFDSFDL